MSKARVETTYSVTVELKFPTVEQAREAVYLATDRETWPSGAIVKSARMTRNESRMYEDEKDDPDYGEEEKGA